MDIDTTHNQFKLTTDECRDLGLPVTLEAWPIGRASELLSVIKDALAVNIATASSMDQFRQYGRLNTMCITVTEIVENANT